MNPRCLFFTLVLFWIVPAISFGQSCDNWLFVAGVDPGVEIGDLDIPGDQVTVEALFNRDVTFNPTFLGGDIVSKHTNPTDVNYLLRPIRAEITTTTGWHATKDACTFNLNRIYHVALVYNGKSLKFYRNGFLMSEVPCSGNLIQNDWVTTGIVGSDARRRLCVCGCGAGR